LRLDKVSLGKYADGLERDVTSQSRFSISQSRIAKVDEVGRVVAIADGQIKLTAEFGGQVTKAQIRIEGSEARPPFSFSRDLGRIFTKRGCNNTDCHGSVIGRGELNILPSELSKDAEFLRRVCLDVSACL